MVKGESTLVTGGAGYVGAVTVRRLIEAGRRVVVLDNLERGNRRSVGDAQLVVGDIRDRAFVERVVAEHRIDSIVHFAGYKNAGESMNDPGRYFDTNVVGSATVLDAAARNGVQHFVFSSSCAVYGMPSRLPVREDDPLQPESPYGESKRIVEQMLQWFDESCGMRFVSLRYFNAAGATFDGTLGESWTATRNLVPLAIKARLGAGPPLRVFGTDYPTPDGTAVRDYVHVCDLADAHVRALEHLEGGESSATLNLGTGQPSSVIDVVDEIERVSGARPPIECAPRRAGDPAIVYADSSRAAHVLGWKPQYGLDDIIRTAWTWHAATATRRASIGGMEQR